ncbi:amidase [Rhodococcus zopfii]
MTTYRTIAGSAAQLRSGEITAVELVEESIANADRTDMEIGVYLRRFDDEARAAAEKTDAALKAGNDPGPLAGIPLGVKDIIATEGAPTTAQSLVLDAEWSAALGDAPVVARLRAAGGVITGKTTTMEFATGVPDPEKPFPIPVNPWDTTRWAGGSSSGTGSGVVVGAFLGGLGTDTGGSIRMPAAFCGISGHKPTFGLVPKSGCVPLAYSLDNIGPMARTAEDCAIMLNALAGFDPSDACSADVAIPDYVGMLQPDLTGLRVGIDTLERFPTSFDEPEVFAALRAAAEVLESLGATVVEVQVPYYEELCSAARITSRSESFAYHADDLAARWDDYFRSTRRGVSGGAFYTAAEYVQAQRVRRVVQRALAELYTTVDLVITPTATVSAFLMDSLDSLQGERFVALKTNYWNGSGNPALSVPMGLSATGMPFGMQIIGRHFEDGTVLRVGDAYQRRTTWHERVPAGTQLVAAGSEE